MQYAYLLIYPAIIFAVTFWGARITKNAGIAPEYMSLVQARIIRAFACLFIILHHITQDITTYGSHPKGPVTLLANIGYLLTAIFFFYSGFGLVTRYYSQSGYLDNFLVKRLLSVLVPFWITNVFAVLLNLIITKRVESAADVLTDISGFYLINGNAWFIIELVFFYILFYLFFTICKNKDVALFLLGIGTVIIMIYGFFNGHEDNVRLHWFTGEWWYNSTPTFMYGAVYARFRKKVDGFFNRHYRIMLPVIAAFTVAAVEFALFANSAFGYYRDFRFGGARFALYTLLAQSLACIVFVTLVMMLGMRITLGNRVMEYIGSISMELYLIHGFFVKQIFGGIKMSEFTRYAVILASSIAFTALVAPAIKFAVQRSLKLAAFCSRENAGDKEKKLSIRKKTLGTAFAIVLMVTAAVAMSFTAISSLVTSRHFAGEIKALSEAEVGDIVTFGKYETDPNKFGKEDLTWIVTRKNGSRVCLMAQYGITGSFYNREHTPVSWKTSDIHNMLNSDEFMKIFNSYEVSALAKSNGDFVSLPTEAEVTSFFETDEDRQLVVTPYAAESGVNVNNLSKDNSWDMKGYRSSWWWLRGDNLKKNINAPIVTVDGTISADEKPVNKPGGAVRPVIWVVFAG